MDHDNIKSTDISVKTDQKVVTLSGFVESQAQAEEAVKVAKGVEGVTSVSDKLHVRDAKEGSVKGYAGDTATTSEIKAKLLADDIVPSRHVKLKPPTAWFSSPVPSIPRHRATVLKVSPKR